MRKLKGQVWSVLDHGSVVVVDVMGDDRSIVQAARVSYTSDPSAEVDHRSLIRHLMRQRHTSPFEMCEIKLHVRAPIDTWRQWIRHRTASVNEHSTRYSAAIEDFYEPGVSGWRDKSGTTLPADISDALTLQDQQLHARLLSVYQSRVAHGVAREQARKDLPLSTYTEAYWKIDLHNLLHFLALRMGPHAQSEIRAYAEVIGREIVARWVPLTWEAFEDFRLRSTTLSSLEAEVLSAHLAGREIAKSYAISRLGTGREYKAARATLGALGVEI